MIVDVLSRIDDKAHVPLPRRIITEDIIHTECEGVHNKANRTETVLEDIKANDNGRLDVARDRVYAELVQADDSAVL